MNTKTSILIVEDEAVIAMGVEADLEKLGYQVAGIAHRGAEALDMAETLKPDLVLMDIMLHGRMDGVETATIIRQRFNLPVIYLTAMADEQTIQRAKLSNSFGYIVKPIRPEELLAAIELGLYKHNLERQVARSEEKVRSQAVFAHQLSQASAHLNAQLTLEKVYETICSEIAQNLGADSIRIALSETQQDGFVPVFEYGRDWKAVAAFTETLLTCEGRLIGAILIAWADPKRDQKEEEEWFLSAFANQASIAIEHARLYETSRRRAEELEILHQLSSKLRQVHTRKEMLPIVLAQAMKISQATAGVIYLLDFGSQPGLCFQSSTLDHPVPAWFQPGEPLWLRVLRDESATIHGEAIQTPDGNGVQPSDSNTLCTKVAFALRTSHGTGGIMALAFPCTVTLDEGTKQVMTALMETVASALQRSGTMEMLEQRVADRTRELSALYDLALIMNSQLDLEQILQESLKRALQPIEAQAAALYLYDAKASALNLVSQIALPREMLADAMQIALTDPLAVWLETSASPRLAFKGQSQMPHSRAGSQSFGTVVNIPVRFESQTLGLLSVVWVEVKDIAAEDIALLSAVAERLGSAIQNRTYRKQLEQAAVVEERHRLARELHDSVTQTVYSLTLLAEAGRDLVAAGNRSLLDNCLQDLQSTSLQALREMRLLLFELHDPEMKDKNLIEALQNRLEAVERRSGIAVELCVDGSIYLSSDYQDELYQIASESLNNVLKHARATRVRIMIESSPEGFAMEIEDDGCGFDPRQIPPGGMGLENIQERIRRLDGVYSFASEPGKGTRIGVQFGQRESCKP